MAFVAWGLRVAPGEVPAIDVSGLGYVLESVAGIGVSMTRSPVLLAVVLVLALGSAISAWLAFFPPAPYARRFEAAGETPAA